MPGKQLLEVGRIVLRLALGKRTPEHPKHRRAFEQHQVGCQLWNGATGEPHHQQPAIPGQPAYRLLEQLATDRVIDHVDPLAVGQALDFLAQAGLAVVDQFICPGCLGHRQFVGTAGGRDYPCPHGLADLHRCQADATGRTQHQQGLTRLQLAALAQGMHRGAIGHAKRRCRGEVHARRDRQHVVERHCHLLGKRPPAGQRHDPVTDLEGAGLFPDRGYHTGRLTTGGERQRWLKLVLAFDDQRVRKVDPGSLHVQQDFVVLRQWAGDFFQHQVARRAKGFAQHSFHWGYSFAGRGR